MINEWITKRRRIIVVLILAIMIMSIVGILMNFRLKNLLQSYMEKQVTEQARTLAKSVVCSNLTKTAIAGHDANWGKILCAMGYSGAQFDPEKVDIWLTSSAGSLKIVENGTDTGYSEECATEILSQEEVTAVCDVKMGEFEAVAYGCDLTYDYVRINGDYRS